MGLDNATSGMRPQLLGHMQATGHSCQTETHLCLTHAWLQTLEALAAAGWPGIVIVDNSRQKVCRGYAGGAESSRAR
jgi:hypothetical protein